MITRHRNSICPRSLLHSFLNPQISTLSLFFGTVGQNSSMVEHHFTGNFLGHKSDIADGSLRDWDFRKYNNIVGDYYIAPSFLDAITVCGMHNQSMD